jgi:hypothetical protein
MPWGRREIAIMTSSDEIFDYVADIVVVGSGAAGLSAAVTAAYEGSSVIVLEADGHPGGTTAKSGGTVWIPNNHLMREHGLVDDRTDALRYMAKLARPGAYDGTEPELGLSPEHFALLSEFYDKGSVALEYLVDIGAMTVVFDPVTPDYHTEENRSPFGRRVPQPPEAVASGGGTALIDSLLKTGQRLGVELILNHRVMAVIQSDNGDVVGVEVRAGLRTVLARARRAVIFGSGGFTHNRAMTQQYLLAPIFGGCAAAGSLGDFVTIGTEVGAQLDNMEHAWFHQVVLEQALRSSEVIQGIWVPFGDSMVQVDRFGMRVVDEKAPYNDRTKAHFVCDRETGESPNRVLLYIYDDSVAADRSVPRYPIPLSEEEVDYVISGQTWAQLRSNIEVRLLSVTEFTDGFSLDENFLPNLLCTIDRFNKFALSGVDEEFHRGEMPISRVWNAPNRPGFTNPTMRPFATEGPYHCILLVAGALDTNGGPRINVRGQVVDRANRPIPGLFGAGNCVGSPAGEGYWGAGGTIGPAITFGHVAGKTAAREPEKLCNFHLET